MKDVIPSNLKSFNLLLLNSVLKLFKAMDPYALGILNRDKIPIIRIVFALASKTPCLGTAKNKHQWENWANLRQWITVRRMMRRSIKETDEGLDEGLDGEEDEEEYDEGVDE